MIVEAFKIVSSIFPFIKEAFLWREGADAAKPVTAKDIRRRKIASFVLAGSALANYLMGTKLYELSSTNTKITQELSEAKAALVKAQETPKVISQVPTNCVAMSQVFDLVSQQIDEEVHAGLLKRVIPNKDVGIKKTGK